MERFGGPWHVFAQTSTQRHSPNHHDFLAKPAMASNGTPDASPSRRRSPLMLPRLVTIILCGTVGAVGCATKSYVNEQVIGVETKLAQQVTTTEASLDN